MATQVTQAVRRKQTLNPKTVLGFYATILGLLFAGVVGIVSVLAATDTSTFLIPWLLGFAGTFLLLLMLGVFIVSLRDPSRLLLTQVSGTEYVAIQTQTVLGDSLTGERVITLAVNSAQPGSADSNGVPSLPSNPVIETPQAESSPTATSEDGQ